MRMNYAGRIFELIGFDAPGLSPDMTFVVEGWWDELTGGSWMHANGNPAAMLYAIRTGCKKENVPTNNEVLYGKIEGLGYLVHECELGKEIL